MVAEKLPQDMYNGLGNATVYGMRDFVFRLNVKRIHVAKTWKVCGIVQEIYTVLNAMHSGKGVHKFSLLHDIIRV